MYYLFICYKSLPFHRIHIRLKISKYIQKKARVKLLDPTQMLIMKERETDFGAINARLELNIKVDMDEEQLWMYYVFHYFP